MTDNFYAVEVNELNGKPFSLSKLKGKLVLIVNTASQCGYTPQYGSLEALFEQYKDDGLVILAFPCNQFGNQEPGEAEQITTFCEKNFGVTFPILEKGEVNGANRHPLYQYLIAQSKSSEDVAWNFEKFLVDQQGAVIARYPSALNPLDSEIEEKIKERLNQNS